ncbi:MAG TPA: hypothetical protein VFP61_06105 [Acidimicrobiales bacterium]|nr:hypothetical protein [Acidimicrobiales bacterium]
MADERLGSLRRAKLKALVRDGRLGGTLPEGAVDGALPGGAAMRSADSARGWVLVDDGAVAGLGAALAWSVRERLPRAGLEVLVETAPARSASRPGDGPRVDAAAVVARRAAEFAPAPTVWAVAGTELRPIVAGDAVAAGEPELPPGDLDRFAAELARHGADPIVEHGVLRGEVLGLEVARAVPETNGGWRLAAGVGRHDRDAREQLRPDQPPGDALDEVVALVRQWRRPGGLRHPANTLSRERWLRSLLVAAPERVGARSLAPLPVPVPTTDLRDATPAAALGTSASTGGPLVVVCSVGVDLDLVPTAADVRLLHAPDAELLVVLPEGDDLPVTRTLAAALARPAQVLAVPRDWQAALAAE